MVSQGLGPPTSSAPLYACLPSGSCCPPLTSVAGGFLKHFSSQAVVWVASPEGALRNFPSGHLTPSPAAASALQPPSDVVVMPLELQRPSPVAR